MNTYPETTFEPNTFSSTTQHPGISTAESAELSEQNPQRPDRHPEPEIIPLDKLDPEIRAAFFPQNEIEPPAATFAPGNPNDDRMLPVFDYEELKVASMRAEDIDWKVKGPIENVINNALKNNGRREVPALEENTLTQRLLALAENMPNFAPVIDYLLAECGFLLTGDPQDFYIPPMLLAGAPGLGKTRFVVKLCAAFGVPFEKFSMGSLQTSSDLTGSSRTWSNTHPGRITELMAKSTTTSPLVLLDEIDKVASGNQYPVLGTLLDLLERDSAKTILDECIGIRFNASRVIYVATANNLSAVDSPLLSRFRILEINTPDAEQRRVIIENVFKDLIGKRDFSIEMEVIDWLAELDMDLRELQRQLREGVGRALMNKEPCLRTNHFRLKTEPKRRGIGFVL